MRLKNTLGALALGTTLGLTAPVSATINSHVNYNREQADSIIGGSNLGTDDKYYGGNVEIDEVEEDPEAEGEYNPYVQVITILNGRKVASFLVNEQDIKSNEGVVAKDLEEDGKVYIIDKKWFDGEKYSQEVITLNQEDPYTKSRMDYIKSRKGGNGTNCDIGKECRLTHDIFNTSIMEFLTAPNYYKQVIINK